MTPAQQFASLFEEMYALCQKHSWGDPFSYARSREIHIAGTLGHTIFPELSGADGIDADGECEYKSTVAKTINAAYNGISVFPTWEEQENYLLNEKIGKYENHYSVRYDGGKIAEAWRLKGDVVLKILLPKLKKKFFDTTARKDPRLGASLTKKEIYEFGERIL